MRVNFPSFAVGFGDEDSGDVEDLKVEQYPPTPLNGKWGFAEVNQSWIGPPDGILGLISREHSSFGSRAISHHFFLRDGLKRI